jgi:hypothetical protein
MPKSVVVMKPAFELRVVIVLLRNQLHKHQHNKVKQL